MDIRQVLWIRGDDTLIMDTPRWFRVLLALIACGLAALMISDGRVYPLPIVLALASGFGALYTQGWEFHPRTGRILSRYGLLVWARTIEYNLSDVETLVLEQFSPGASTRRRFLRMKLLLRDGEECILEIQRQRGSALPQYARQIASAMNFPLDSEVPRASDERG